ncbi:archease, partial [Halorubrum tebenquichense]
MSYDLRDHTADVAVEATADTPSALFAAVADGLTAASAESVPAAGERFEFAVEAEGREALLFDYLDRLIYERDVRLVLPADH